MSDLKHELNRRILLVDDESKILDELQKILVPNEMVGRELKELESRLFGDAPDTSSARQTYQVDCCRQAEDALQAVQTALEQQAPYAVAFMDVRMPPGKDGVWAAEKIRKIDPNLQIVMMTGYSDFDISEIARRVPPEDKLLYVQKPVHAQEIRQFALALTAKWQSDYLLHVQNEYLKEVNRKLVEHDHMKSEFVMTVSHELRTPLTIFKNIISNAKAGVMGKIPEKLEERLDIADEAINRLKTIIDDFLDVSRLEVGKVELRTESLCIQKLIDDILEMIRFVADQKAVTLDKHLPECELYVSADYEKLTRVFTNLVDNALKYAPEQQGKIRIRAEEHDGQVLVSVEDNGPGIHGDHKDIVFNKFVQIQKHIGPGKHGTGLGLSICKDLVTLHGGSIWVEDNPEGGACFKVLLPQYVPADENDNDETTQAESIEQSAAV